MNEAPSLFSLRKPDRDRAELVVTVGGKSTVYPLTFDQVRLLNWQSAEAIKGWEVQEVPFA